jgi:hypothetical protein
LFSIAPIQLLWKYIAGNSAPPLDVAMLLSLMVAFPATLIYKLIHNNKEPFPGGSQNPFSSSQLVSGGDKVVMPQVCLELSAIVQLLGIYPASISDALGPASPMIVTVSSVGLSILGFLLSNGNLMIDYVGGALAAIGIAVGGVLIKTGVVTLRSLTPTESDVLNVLLSVYGLGKLIYGAIQAPNEDKLQIAANVLVPLPTILSFLNLYSIRNTQGELTIPIKLVADCVGYLGGGACELIDSINGPSINAAQAQPL